MNEDSLSCPGRRNTFRGAAIRGTAIRGAAQWSRDTAVACCCCCCDGADATATELMLRAASVPPRGAAATLLEVPRCCHEYKYHVIVHTSKNIEKYAFSLMRSVRGVLGEGW